MRKPNFVACEHKARTYIISRKGIILKGVDQQAGLHHSCSHKTKSSFSCIKAHNVLLKHAC